jgi:hypothetical protein
MIQPAIVAALAAVIGGAVAVWFRDSRLVALGLLLALVASPLAASPEPSALSICFRALGAALAAYLLAASAHAQSIESEGSGIGLLAEMAAVCAAFAVGWFAAPVQPLAGPVAAQAAGFALIALAVVPLSGRDVLRVGTGAAVLAIGVSLLLQAWAEPATSAQQMAVTVLFVGLIAATSLLIRPVPTPSPVEGPPAGEAPAVVDVPEVAAAAEVEAPAGEAPAGEDVPTAAVPAPDAPADVPPIRARTTGIRSSTSRLRRAAGEPTTAGAEPAADAEPAAAAATDADAAAGPAAVPSPRARRLHPREPRR